MSHFEVRHDDAAGRLGELTLPRRHVTIETPALLPVVNPRPDRLADDPRIRVRCRDKHHQQPRSPRSDDFDGVIDRTDQASL